MIELEIISKRTQTKYTYLKSRKEFIEKQIRIYRTLDFLCENAKKQILIGLSNELQHIQMQIVDLIWS